MTIRMGPDLGAPLIVTAVNLTADAMLPRYSKWITYGMTIVGYLGGFTNRGGDILKNIGVSSLPLTARSIYENVRSISAPVSKMSYRAGGRVGRYPASSVEAPFSGVKLT